MARKRRARKPSVSDQLRDAIRALGKSLYRIGAETGLDDGLLSRFMRGERTITSRNVDRLCAYLGLELRESKRKGE